MKTDETVVVIVTKEGRVFILENGEEVRLSASHKPMIVKRIPGSKSDAGYRAARIAKRFDHDISEVRCMPLFEALRKYSDGGKLERYILDTTTARDRRRQRRADLKATKETA